MTNSLYIVNALDKKYAMSQEDAEQILPTLENAISHRESIELSFEGLENCSTIFINTLLGGLYLTYGKEVDNFIHLVGISNDDLVLPDRLDRLRKRIFNADYKSILDNSIGQA